MPKNLGITLEKVHMKNEAFYRISNVDKMHPFLMSIVSDSNHWMFISSNGGLTAGRKDAENALFPYYTDDKLSELYDITGSKSIFWVTKGGKSSIWEPFAEHHLGQYSYSRNLYKSFYGNKIIFEEIHEDVGLTFRYQWNSSNLYGFVRKCELINHSGSEVSIKLLDGIQNIMPHGVSSDLQVRQSNLVDAYKRNELQVEYGLGIYSLSAIIVDRAEPSEALKANVAWSIGFDSPQYLLTSQQLSAFRKGEEIHMETDEKARKGAYFISTKIKLSSQEERSWMVVANVNQSATSVATLCEQIGDTKGMVELINQDIERGSKNLSGLVSSSDGFQLTEDSRRNARHYSNTLFNIMRGGIFDDNYQIERWDFESYLIKANNKAESSWKGLIKSLPERFQVQDLKKAIAASVDKDLKRLALEYLPLKFSRRHGDPSRPWNRFSINTISEVDGSKILDYEGNWRDIFQNWEALVHSYPEFIDGMILKFLNASTFDGYNPYRITKDGFDWEVIEPHDPWSYIGYWGDHQVIYLLKFLEFAHDHYPDRLKSYFSDDLFVYANVPYKIKPYEEILEDPKDTIIFDQDLDHKIRTRRQDIGSDGALILDKDQNIHQVNFIEKILVVVLAKLSNFIPEGGIWMNTQRPEWNDANNALVGNGVSMVTLYYLRRFLSFMNKAIANHGNEEYQLSEEVTILFKEISKILTEHQAALSAALTDEKRKHILDGLGTAGSNYRDQIYKKSFSGKRSSINTADLKEFIELGLKYLDPSIDANKRADGMYHAYNIMSSDKREVSISHLQEMLEGQVAVLSSGYLSSNESLELLDALKQSKLFRADQYSYLLYPNNQLPGFMVKNVIPKEKVESSQLLKQLVSDGNTQIIERDVKGKYHFNGNFNNASDLKKMLYEVSLRGYKDLVKEEEKLVLQIFEGVFNHKAFTGRSGTFYGYEGLGSIYWHMVSKLLLAVEECCHRAVDEGESKEIVGRLMEHYYEINEGVGVHKSPDLYGAFPIDPYSHTPAGKGVQQPGMTGQVKEDILSRIGEIGIKVDNGAIHFKPSLLRRSEFLKEGTTFEYPDIHHQTRSLGIPKDSIVFTYCQVPVVFQIEERNSIRVNFSNGDSALIDSLSLDNEISRKIFSRTGDVDHLVVFINNSLLN
ncbi:MAG: hypothetical protein ACFHWX_02305 [Bacteroidota bacterium]